MKHYFIFYFFVSCYCIAQPNDGSYLFNKLYPPEKPTYARSYVAAIPIENNHYIVAGTHHSTENEIYVQKHDEKGDIKWHTTVLKTTDFATTYFGSALTKGHDGNFLVTAKRGKEKWDTDYIVGKVTPYGKLVWVKEYPYPLNDDCMHIIACKQGGYLVAGTNQEVIPVVKNAHFQLLRLTENGDTLWRKKTAITNFAVLDLSQTSDSGYVFSGYRYNKETGYDMFAVKTDSLGIIEWQQTYGTPYDDGGCHVMERPKIQGSYPSYLLVGLINTGGGQEYKKGIYYAHLSKKDGKVFWIEKIYEPNKVDIYGSSSEWMDEKGEIYSATHSYSSIIPVYNEITKFNSSGDTLWKRPIATGLPDDDYIRDIRQCEDGGFILAGFNFSIPNTAWLVKTDSLGYTCGLPNCDSTLINTSVSHPIKSKANIILSPNPVNLNQPIQIQYTLPPQILEAVLEFYDEQGRKVAYNMLLNVLNTCSIEPLPKKGLYTWQVKTPYKVLSSGKLVVQ